MICLHPIHYFPTGAPWDSPALCRRGRHGWDPPQMTQHWQHRAVAADGSRETGHTENLPLSQGRRVQREVGRLSEWMISKVTCSTENMALSPHYCPSLLGLSPCCHSQAKGKVPGTFGDHQPGSYTEVPSYQLCGTSA